MPTVLEKQLFRLSNLRENWMEVELTPEEASKLTQLPAPIRGATHQTGNLGYIDPTKVKRYFVDELGRVYEGSPDLHVNIHFPQYQEPESYRYRIIGGYWFTHKEDGKTFGIFTGPVFEGDAIDVKYVYEDNSGKFIPITRERIEAKIRDAYESIAKGFGGVLEIEDAERLAEVSGLDLVEQLRELKRHAEEDDLGRYNEPDHLRKKLDELIGIFEWASLESLGESGKYEEFDEFFGKLPKLTIPADMQGDVQSIIGSYLRLYDDAIAVQQERMSETQSDIERLQAEKSRLRQQLVFQPVK